MLKNRSVPADAVLPHVVYPDVAAALAWLNGAFGFTEHYRYGDALSTARRSDVRPLSDADASAI